MTRQELGQLLNLRVQLITTDNRPGDRMRPASIVVHNTGNRGVGANADAHAKYLELPEAMERQVSWHYTVDDVEVVKHIPTNEVAWHAGPANDTSIGIEICMHDGIDQHAADQRAARLIAALLYDFGWGVESVRTHESVTGKRCPELLLPDWDMFLHEVGRNLWYAREAGRPATESPGEEPMDKIIRMDEVFEAITVTLAAVADGRITKEEGERILDELKDVIDAQAVFNKLWGKVVDVAHRDADELRAAAQRKRDRAAELEAEGRHKRAAQKLRTAEELERKAAQR